MTNVYKLLCNRCHTLQIIIINNSIVIIFYYAEMSPLKQLIILSKLMAIKSMKVNRKIITNVFVNLIKQTICHENV